MSLSASHLYFTYGDRPILEDVSLTVRDGEIVAVLGANASGKTTLLKNLSGLLTPTAGFVHWQERPLSDLTPRARAQVIGYIPQEEEIFLPFTVEDVVLIGRAPHLGFLGLESAADRALVDRILETMRLTSLRRRPLQELSGGEKQRVHIARVMAQEASYWILDEPTSHLDLRFQHELMTLCRDANASHSVSVILSLHDPHLAARYAHRVIFLKNGRILADGPTNEVLTTERIREVFDLSPEISGPFF